MTDHTIAINDGNALWRLKSQEDIVLWQRVNYCPTQGLKGS